MNVDTEHVKARLLHELQERQNELIALCAESVRIPSENPPGDTTAIATFVQEYLAQRGCAIHTYAPREGRPNLIAMLDSGVPGPRLLLNSHLDEFPAVGGQWERPPFSGEIDNGRIFGRGASDMRAGLAVSLFLSRLISELELNLPGQLIISFSSDEESGGTWGTRWLLKHVPEVRADACLIGDQCGTWAVGIGEKGGVWVRLRTTGVSGHAAYGTARSAVRPMVHALAIVESLEALESAPPPSLRPVIERERSLIAAHWGEEAPKILDRVTANIGQVHGGVSINLVADSCEAEVDIRLPVGLSTTEVVTALRGRLDRAGLSEVQIDLLTAFEPNWTGPDHPLVQAVIKNSEQVRGRAALPVLRLGATDARWFRAAGIPTVVYGPTAHNMGGANEYVTIEDLLVTAQVHAGAIVDYLTGSASEAD